MRKLWVEAASVVVVVIVGVGAGVSSAHVTTDPESAPKGAADQTITFRAPNEQDSANMVALKVQLPADHPIASVDPAAMPGWTASVKTTHLTTPIVTDDGSISDVPSEIDWTGGSVPPGEFGQFTVLAMGLPKDADSLTFKAIQTYDNGQETAWIEVPEAGQSAPEHPAAVMALTAASDEAATGTSGTSVSASPTTTVAVAQTAAATTTSSSDSSKGLAIAGIVIGALGVALAVAALVFARAKSSGSTSQT